MARLAIHFSQLFSEHGTNSPYLAADSFNATENSSKFNAVCKPVQDVQASEETYQLIIRD